MATTYCTECADLAKTPPMRISDVAQRGRKKHIRATIPLASQPSGDNIVLGTRPAGSRMGAIEITSSVSLGSSTLAIGVAGTTGKYRAAATFTAVDTPTRVALSARLADTPLTADETIIATIGAASLPASGTLVIDIEYIES